MRKTSRKVNELLERNGADLDASLVTTTAQTVKERAFRHSLQWRS